MNNYYDDQELVENPPEIPDLSKLKRLIIQENPRVQDLKDVLLLLSLDLLCLESFSCVRFF